MNKVVLIAPLMLLPSCSLWNINPKAQVDSSPTPLINLVESTHIIRTLITQNRIADLLEDHNPEQLELLLNNKSPAQMAFESEVLSTTVPIVIVYYFEESKINILFIKQLEELAIKYNNQVKFVLIDTERLFSLAEDAQIEKLPTLLFVQNRDIIDRVEGNFSVSLLEVIVAKHTSLET